MKAHQTSVQCNEIKPFRNARAMNGNCHQMAPKLVAMATSLECLQIEVQIIYLHS